MADVLIIAAKIRPMAEDIPDTPHDIGLKISLVFCAAI
jgi:hypothetical protein